MDFQSTKSFGKLRLRAFQPYHQILYMLTLSTQGISISNAFNAIYVDTVDTKHIHTFLPITFLIFNGFSICKKFWKAETQGFSTIPSILYMSILSIQGKDLLMHSMLSMLTLLIQFSHLIVLCIRCCVRATNTSVNSVDKHSFNALRALIFISTVSTNKIPYSIHNSVALIFCIDHLDMPSCPFELQCRF